MKYIELTKGLKAIVDDEDFKYLNELSWHAQPKRNTYYAIGHQIKDGKRTTRRMHRIVVGAKDNEVVDHINGNGLDNRKINLRITDAKGNARNRKNSSKTSPYKGVRFLGVLKKTKEELWVARISKNRKVEVIGYFNNAEDAAKAYDIEAFKRFGNYAFLNFGGKYVK